MMIKETELEKEGTRQVRKETEEFIRQHHMAESGDQILAAVSGGADSVCLLYVLAQMREDWNLKLRAFHVHHGLRGEEADRDRKAAQRTAERLNVPFAWEQVDVKVFQAEKGLSEEEAARILRYQALCAEAEKWEKESGRMVKIAVAHQQDDNAETVLHHLFRGSGLRGLSGIAPVRGRIIRPLLWASGQEIREFLNGEGIEFCEDSTNASQAYTRNRIRHQVLPLISSGINPQAVPHICQAAQRIAQADEYLELQAGKWLGREGAVEPGRIRIEAEKLLEEPEIIRSYVLRCMVQEMGKGMKDLSALHIQALEELLQKQSGKQADLPEGLRAVRQGKYLVLEQKREKSQAKSRPPQIEYSVFVLEKGMKFPENLYTKWFDYDRINGALSVRTRQAGDYFYLPGGGRKTVKSYMIDEKIPADRRDGIFLLAEGNHILWIIGRRISEKVKITPQTRRVLQVHVSGGEENGR